MLQTKGEPDLVRWTDYRQRQGWPGDRARYREKVTATTWSSRQDARIRYTAPAVADGRSTSVTEIDLYRSLKETLGPV